MEIGSNLDSILDELTDLAHNAPTPDKFFSAILEAAKNATKATDVAVWSMTQDNYRLETQIGSLRSLIAKNSDLRRMHEEALEIACYQNSRPNADSSESWPIQREYASSRYRFFSCSKDSRNCLVIELVHHGETGVEDSWTNNLMSAIVEIANDYRNARRLDQFEREDHVWRDFHRVLPQIHSSVALQSTSHSIANEGRQFLRCERMSVAGVRKDEVSILAVSGVASIEHRSKQIRELEVLVGAVLLSGTPLRYPSEAPEPPQREDPLQRYIDNSQCQSLFIQPLYPINAKEIPQADSVKCNGALVLESFQANASRDFDERFELFLNQANIAFQNAWTIENMPLYRLSHGIQTMFPWFGNLKFKLSIIGVGAGVLLAMAMLIQVDFAMEAWGTIQPMKLQHLYAPSNGEIVRVNAKHQNQIGENEVAIELRSREIELRKEELVTQRAVTQEKLRGIEAARLRDRKTGSTEPPNSSSLAASEKELKEVLASQNDQMKILEEMLDSLKLRSPFAGIVISWSQSEYLERRPVQQGQKLMTIAANDGAGRLVLRVNDEDSRFVTQAMHRNTQRLPVTFSIASDPGKRHEATLHEVGTIVESSNDGLVSLRAEAFVSESEMKNARPGATVVAKIHCGTSSIGYVWTRRFWDFLLMRWY